MSPVEKGKFCENCSKVVYDFSEKTEADFNLLYQLNNGNICGRFGPDQIDQDYAYIVRASVNKKFLKLKRFCSFLIAFIVLKLSSVRTGFAQQSVATSFGNSIKIDLPDPNYRKSEKSDVKVKGRVLKEGSEGGLVNVEVVLYDSEGKILATGLTDQMGDFSISLPDGVNMNQTFVITADKEKSKNRARVTTYSKDEKEISEKDFENVLLEVKVHKRVRRDLLGRRKFRGPMGCPKFR